MYYGARFTERVHKTKGGCEVTLAAVGILTGLLPGSDHPDLSLSS